MNIIFAVSNICTAFKEQTIGSKVLDTLDFLEALTTALESYDSSKDRVPGQHFVIMPEGKHLVSAGDGLKTDNAEDFVVRTHREGPKMFLKRECAGEVQFLATVVYTREARFRALLFHPRMGDWYGWISDCKDDRTSIRSILAQDSRSTGKGTKREDELRPVLPRRQEG